MEAPARSLLLRPATLAALAALALGLVVALGALDGPRARADLEVTLPPGTPTEWYRELADRPPRYRMVLSDRDKPKEEKEDKKKGTQVREKENITTEVQSRPELGSGTYQPMIFSGVLTVDLPFHVKWVARKTDAEPRQYPPPVTDDLYWYAQAGYLRRLLHPAMVPEPEIYWFLVMMGDPARAVAAGAKEERFLEPLASAVDAAVGKPPADAPETPELGGSPTAEEKMLVKLARVELMDGDPYSLDPTYAGALLSLGDAGLPALVACAKSPHALLRRNAVAVLGSYPQPEALEALRKVFREDKDLCARTRALFHLVRRKDAEIVPDLTKALDAAAGGTAEEKRFAPLAAFGLGLIGKAESAPALASAIEKNFQSWEIIVPSVVALARCASASTPPNPLAVKTLKTLEETLRGPVPRFTEDRTIARPAADIPDTPELKNRMLLELATAALARLGDREGIARLKQLIDGRYDADQKNPVGHARANGPERASQCDALKWVCPSTHEILIEAWGALGGEGALRLRQVIDHGKTNEKLRIAAIKLDPIAKDKRYLGELALNSESAAVRALALRLLYNIDDKAGLKVAEAIFGTYVSGKPMSKTNPKGDVSVISALEVLFRGKKLKTGVLKLALGRAMSEWEYVKADVTAEGMKPFRFSPPLLDTICWMLGATQEKDAVPLLVKVASDPKLPARAEATLALGRIPGDAPLSALADLISDDDGWVRYNAFLALRSATGEDHFADFIYGQKGEWEDAAGKYKEIVKKKK